MVKLVKGLLIVVVVLLLVLMLGIFIAAKVIDPNDYKPVIIDQVKQHTGRDLLIEGDLGWQLWPPLGISIGQTQLKNTAEFGGDDMLRFNKVVVDVQLLPLLSKSVIVDEVNIDGFYFHRITNAKGETNLDDLLAATSSPSEQEPTTTPAQDEGGMPLEELRVGKGISITNALIIDENQASQVRQQVELVSLSVGQFAFDSWFPVALEFKAGLTEPQLSATVQWESELQVNRALDSFLIKEGVLLVDGLGDALPKPVNLRLDTEVSVDLSSQQLTADPLLLKVDDLELSAPLSISGLTSAPLLISNITMATSNARALMEELGIELDTTDEQVLTRVDLSATLNFDVNASRLTVDNLQIGLDDTQLKGEFNLQTGATLVSRFNINVDQFNLDRYLPPAAPADEQPEATPPSSEKTPPPDISFLQAMDVEGKVQVGKLQAKRVEVERIDLNLLIKQGRLQLAPLTAAIYEGTVRTDFSLNANPKVPTFELQQGIDNVPVGPLLLAVADSDMLSGATDLKLRIKASSLDPEVIQQTLNGEGQFLFKDGALKGINVAQLIRDARAKIRGEPVATEATAREVKQTDFSELRGSFTITNGLVSNPDLKMLSPLLRIRGNGDVNLPAQAIDYQTKVSLVSTLKGQGGKAAQDLGRLTIPLAIGGSFEEPKIKLDLEGAMKDKAKAQLDKERDKAGDKAKDKLREKAREELGIELEKQSSKEIKEELSDKLEDKAKEKLSEELERLFK